MSFQAFQSFLDGVDSATVDLILKLQFADNDDADEDAEARRLQQTAIEEYRTARGLPAQPPPVPDVECSVCTETIPITSAYTSACPQRHCYCSKCLDVTFRQAMHDERFYEPNCCKESIPFDSIKLLIPAPLVREFEAKQPELDDKNKIYCHVPTCSAYFGNELRANGTATCPTCKEATCTECKAASHNGQVCPENRTDNVLIEYAKEQGFRRCPGCSRMIELNTGCNHMTCLCKAEFCYKCGSHPWKTPDPVTGVQRRTCTCSQFDDTQLFARAQEIAIRENRDAQAVMAHLRENHECEHETWDKHYGRHDCEECGDTLFRFIFRCRQCRAQRCFRCRVGM